MRKRKNLCDVSQRHLRRLLRTTTKQFRPASQLNCTTTKCNERVEIGLLENSDVPIDSVNDVFLQHKSAEVDGINMSCVYEKNEYVDETPFETHPSLPVEKLGVCDNYESSSGRIKKESYNIYDDTDEYYDAENFLGLCETNDNPIDNLSDDESNRRENEEFLKFEIALRNWALKFRITHVALTSLLLLLRLHSCFSGKLPKCAKTFLKTPRFTIVIDVKPGKYWHYGVSNGIRLALKGVKTVMAFIKLKVGIDGLPLSDSNGNQFYPILGSIGHKSKVFIIGCFFAKTKPTSFNDFLKSFVDEMKQLTMDGLFYQNRNIDITMDGLVCDAPAAASVLNIKGHAGYSSCSKCTVEGEYLQNRMSFYEINCPKRTDDSFLNHEDDEHHNGQKIMQEIPNFGLVTGVPLDYMHLVCIGVVKKLIGLWISQKFLSSSDVTSVSEHLVKLRPYVTKEFSRLPREISLYSLWKATECRQFLLYTGPVVLKKVLSYRLNHIYLNFLSLHVAIRILCCPDLVITYIDYAEKLLFYFVTSFIENFGEAFVSHNVHGLIHLPDDCRRFGTLDNFSAFPFENFMKILKAFIRKPANPLQQLHRRYMEIETGLLTENDNDSSHVGLANEHRSGPLVEGLYSPQFQTYVFHDFTLTTHTPNNCCLLSDESIICINNFATSSSKQMYVIGKKFLERISMYPFPDVAEALQCSKVGKLSDLRSWPLDSIKTKCMLLPDFDEVGMWFAIPLLHNDMHYQKN